MTRTVAPSTWKSRAFSFSAPEATLAKTIVLSANSDWNIVNFRQGLIKGLRGAGYEPVVIAPADPAAAARMRKLDIEQFPVRIERAGLNPSADLLLLASYRRLLQQLRPAAYLGYTIKPNIYGSWAAASLDIPAVPNVSGLGTAFMRPGMLQTLVKGLYRVGFSRAPAVLFQNEEDRDLFVKRRIVTHQQARLLAGSGVDLDRFAPVPLPKGTLTFLLIGRLLRDKGVVEFVEAARIVKRQRPEARFQLLGPIDKGNRTAITAAQLEAWVQEGLIEYLGQTDDVRPFIASATAVVLPSYREGMPRSLLEAAAMGRPLIASDVPGCRQAVDHQVNGFLCNVRDSVSLAAAMARVADMSDTDRTAMGLAGRRKVEEQFSEQRVVDAYLDILEQLESGKLG